MGFGYDVFCYDFMVVQLSPTAKGFDCGFWI